MKHLKPKKTLDKLRDSIKLLSGATQDYMRLFSWNIDTGKLTKLKNYCAFLNQISGLESKEINTINRLANRSWLLCLNTFDLINALELCKKNTEVRKVFTALKHTLEKIQNYFQKLARLLAQLMKDYVDDENVIFFLLRNKELINDYYGSQFLTKLLSKMYPTGLKEVNKFLSRRFKKRGFENFIPHIHLKLTELEIS